MKCAINKQTEIIHENHTVNKSWYENQGNYYYSSTQWLDILSKQQLLGVEASGFIFDLCILTLN